MGLDKALVKICQLSSEYYYLVPKPGFEFERVTPIDSSSSLKEEKHRLDLLLEFETAKALVLGAMLRRKEVNPMDYVYSCLDSRLQLLTEESAEAQLLLRYLYRSKSSSWENCQ